MLKNPYNINGNWYRGNFHTHTKNSPCGHYDLEWVLNLYKSYKENYDFLAITDHFYMTDLSKYNDSKDLILFNGVEFKLKCYQTLGINIPEYTDNKDDYSNHQELFDKVNKEGGINIICHPHLSKDDYWSYDSLMKLKGYIGIEVYNNNVRLDNSGRAVASDLWDKLLSSGRKIYGFADDDMHVFSRVGGGFNMVCAKEKSRESILESVKKGRFYASSGVFLKDICVSDDEISLKLEHNIPAYIRFIGYKGKLLKETFGLEGSYKADGSEKYIRVEVFREDGAKAWTQPFYFC